MKAAICAFLLAVCSAVMLAQTGAAPSGDVTIGLTAGAPEYCLGTLSSSPLYSQLFQTGTSSGDITLRLPLRLRYQNQRSETVFLPAGYNFLMRMTVDGQSGSTILRQGGGGAQGLDVKSLMALSRPEAGPFWTVTGGKGASPSVPDLSVMKFQDTIDDFVIIPVLRPSSGVDLRGKTVQIVTSRDFRSSIAPEVVEQLNQKWKEYGIVWARVVESDAVTIRIPGEPLTRNCAVTSRSPAR
jgi:hypothetical protein